MNHFQKGHLKALMGVIFDIHSVLTSPEVRIGDMGASHDPESGANIKNTGVNISTWKEKLFPRDFLKIRNFSHSNFQNLVHS